MDDVVQAFYDELADDYHLLYADWRASMQRQAAALNRLIGETLGAGRYAVLDCACGVGTQAIGLALLGYWVHATDLSARAVARARREAEAAEVVMTFGVADLRMLADEVSGQFDVVMACDNALPHLLDDADLQLAIANLAVKLRPGGILLASIRDYDHLMLERPRTEEPRVFDDASHRRITFQVWDWAEDGRRYDLHQFIVQQNGEAWYARHFSTTYRALLRDELEKALREAGFVDIRWHEPAESGFFQPIVSARRP